MSDDKSKKLENSEYVRTLTEKRQANPQDFAMQKSQYESAVKQDADKSQPGTMEMLGNLAKSIVGKKTGGMISHVEHIQKTAGGTHHSEHYKKHAGGHKLHNDHIKEFGKK